VLEAERHFRRLQGFAAMPKLAAALRAHHEELDRYRPNSQDADAARIAERPQLTQ
jgi:hypothetical protein